MTVRRGEPRDCAAVVALAKEAWPDTPFAYAHQPDDAFLEQAVERFLAGEGNAGFVLVDKADVPRGVFALGVFQHPFSGQSLASVLMWWVTPCARGYGMSLVKKAEEWARSKGVDELHLYAHTPELERFCALSGYRPLETTYRKVL